MPESPNFTAAAVLPDGSIKGDFSLSDYAGKYVVIFFYRSTFTFVCPSEILAHNSRVDEFKKRGVNVIGVSIDSQFTHAAWRNTPTNNGGIGAIGFPLVADVKHEITQAYGVEHPQAGVALRGSFLIDKAGVVQHMVINNLPLGRNVDEMLRMVDALQFTEENGEVCPAGWNKGDEGMKPDAAGVAKYLSKHATACNPLLPAQAVQRTLGGLLHKTTPREFHPQPKRIWLDIVVGIVLISMLVFGSIGIYRLNNDAREREMSSALAMQGQMLSTDLGCVACHTVDGSPGVGPSWLGMWGRTETLESGTTVVVDEAYFRDSLKEPNRKVVKGYPNVMLRYFLEEGEITALMEFAKQLPAGEK